MKLSLENILYYKWIKYERKSYYTIKIFSKGKEIKNVLNVANKTIIYIYIYIYIYIITQFNSFNLYFGTLFSNKKTYKVNIYIKAKLKKITNTKTQFFSYYKMIKDASPKA